MKIKDEKDSRFRLRYLSVIRPCLSRFIRAPLCSFDVDRNAPAGQNVVRAGKMNGSQINLGLYFCVMAVRRPQSSFSLSVVLAENDAADRPTRFPLIVPRIAH